MKVWTPLTLIFALSTTVYAQDTCTHPPTPSTPPDGNTATKDDMVAGSKVVRAYAEDMDAYLKCVQAKTLKGAEKTAAEQSKKEKEQLTKKYDAAVDEEKANAERFNVQLRIWKAKAKS
jgi:hypothetical protein